MSHFIARATIVVEGDTFEEAIENYAADHDLRTAFAPVIEPALEPTLEELETELLEMRDAEQPADIERLTVVSKQLKRHHAAGADVTACQEHLRRLVLGG